MRVRALTLALTRLLSKLARGGVTVIATIHQPSAAAFFTFDRLLLLDKGAIAYQVTRTRTRARARARTLNPICQA